MDIPEIEKSIYLLKYLKIENIQTKGTHEEARIAFLNEIRTLHHDLNVYDKDLDAGYVKNISVPDSSKSEKEPNQNYSTPDFEPDKEIEIYKSSSQKPSWTKAIYRKIAMKTHPDKFKKGISREEQKKLVKIYELSSAAYAEEDYGQLILCAIDIDVEIPRDKDVLICLSQVSRELESESSVLKQSVFWIWYHSTKEEQKKYFMSI